MSGYGDVKRRKILQLLKWLENSRGVEVIDGHRHPKVKIISNNEVFPVPCRHGVVNKYIVKKFCDWLVKYKICSKKEFDERT